MNSSEVSYYPEMHPRYLYHGEVASDSVLSALEIRTDYLLKKTSPGNFYDGYLASRDGASDTLTFHEVDGGEFSKIHIKEGPNSRSIYMISAHLQVGGGRQIVETQISFHEDGGTTFDKMVRNGVGRDIKIAFMQPWTPEYDARRILDQLTRISTAEPTPPRRSVLSKIGGLFFSK